MLILDVPILIFSFTFSLDAKFSLAFDIRDVSDVFPPADVERRLDAMRARNVLPDGGPIDVATGISQISNLGEGEPQGTVLMNELRHSVADKLDGRDDPHGKSGLRGISTLTVDSFALEAILAGVRPAISVNRACVARIPQNAGRKQRGLVHSIYGYKKLRHWIFPLHGSC